MLITERHDRILQQLEIEGMVCVSELSRAFAVSEETIRRDLEKLETEGYARRCYGGASFTGGKDLPIKVRIKSNVTGKRRIASLVARQIPDGACVALDDSSTANFVAEELKDKKKLTIITYSLEIAVLLADKEDWKIILTGGTLKHKHLSIIGPMAIESIAKYCIDWAVISCAGLDCERGIFDATEENAGIKQALISSSEHVILAADKQKFKRKALALICPFDGVDEIVSDEAPEKRWLDAFDNSGTEFLCAE